MEPFLIAFDMDGTLLNDKKNISYRTKRYLLSLAKKGHKIVLASGRPSRAMWRYYNELKLDTPLICYNGAYTFSPKDKNFPTSIFEFPKDVVKEVYLQVKPYALNVMCETDTEIWVDKSDQYLAKFFWYDGMDIKFGDLDKTLDKNPMTMIVQTPEELKDTEPIKKIVAKYEGLEARFWTGSPYFELFYKNISKGSALKLIAEYYNIPKERIIAFGDAGNDVEMFEVAGTAVMMSNGKATLKEKSHMVSIKDNNHNGIYHTLKYLFKNK